ncbi:Fe(3+)-hydroxamate ABC transporter permease FhuB (plasmid) [Moraxella atlantae]|uniref:Fe(3+)-hydroxamate ABC transporter permease FhuB n=1 Tax=Faucicola atlantae TaxID=34059 RepID=UPI003751D634
MNQLTPISTFTKNKLAIVFIFLLLAFAFASSLQLIHSRWHLAFLALLQASSNLTVTDMAVQLSLLPTMLVAILAGGILGSSSVLLQQLVKNTLASDTTLAVGSGAQMALLIVTLFLPSFGLYGSFWVAFIGAMLSMGLVFVLSAPSRMNPVVLVLSGLVVNILISSIASVLLVFNPEMALGVMVWGSGSLTQSSWDATLDLMVATVLGAMCLIPLYKPLMLMSLDDRQAQSLGVPVKWVRLALTVLVAMLTALVVSHLGSLSFIGLAAATLTNGLKVRHLSSRLVISFLVGGLLLWLASNIAMLFEGTLPMAIPAGALTGILGAPLIIWLTLRQRKTAVEAIIPVISADKKPISLALFSVALLVCLLIALFFSQQVINGNQVQWAMSSLANWKLIQTYRLPRTLSAAATGILLATAGVLLQTLTRNPMASPEVLGISSGAALGVILAFILLPLFGVAMVSQAYFGVAGIIGALAVLILILWMARKIDSGYLLLVGVAITALMEGVLSLIKLSGDPRLQAILNWLSGTTYSANPATAWWLSLVAIVVFTVSILIVKPLELIGLGHTVAKGRGLATQRFEMGVLMLIAIASTAATLAVGPLSFIGLMIPHLAITMGAVGLPKQLPVAAILGASMMIIADWFGRYVIFPYEIPAGTIAAIVGGGYFIYLMRKMR